MADPPTKPPDKPLIWMGASMKDLMGFPEEVRREIGHFLWAAQQGRKPETAVPLTGEPEFKGTAVMEIVADGDRATYRAVYTVRFEGVVYVLHAFQKKSTSGIATPRREIELVKRRLAAAAAYHKANFARQDTG